MLTEEMLREVAGEDLFSQGRSIFHRALVREARRNEDGILYLVSGEDRHHVSVTLNSIRCDCGAFPCVHGVAAGLTALESGVIQEMEKHRAQQAVPALFEAVSTALPETDDVFGETDLPVDLEGLTGGEK